MNISRCRASHCVLAAALLMHGGSDAIAADTANSATIDRSAKAQEALPQEALPNEAAWSQLAALEFSSTAPVRFRETRQSRLLRTPKTQSGRLRIDDNGDFVMHIETPKAEERRLSGNRLSLSRNGKTRSTRLDPQRGAHQLLLAVVDILQGNTLRLQQNFIVTRSASANVASPQPAPQNSPQNSRKTSANTSEWRWALTPKDEAMRQELSQLVIVGDANTLTSLRAERGRSWQEIQLLGTSPQP